MKAAVALALSAAFLPLAAPSLRAQSGSPFVETTTLTFYWSYTHSYITNASTPIPTLPDLATYDPSALPSGYETFIDTIRAQPYTGAPAGRIPASAANQQIISRLLQRMVRAGQIGSLDLTWRWQLIAVREAPANVRELASNPYRVFLSGQAPSGPNSLAPLSYEAYSFGREAVIDDPVPTAYIAKTVSPSGLVTLDTGITITLGQHSGSYTETDWGAGNDRVRKATGSVATAFRVDFGSLFYDDPLHGQTNPSRLPYNYHLKRHYWEGSASGLINYNIRTILPPVGDIWLPTFVATNSSATATGWFYHEYSEFTGAMVNNFPVYRAVPGAAYSASGIAPLKVTLSTVQYQKRDRFQLDLPDAPSDVSTVTVADGEVEVSWTDNSSNETGFVIQRALDPAGPWVNVVTTNANGSPFTDAGLPLDTVFYYRVYAFNGGGASDFSDDAVATTVAAPSDLDAGAIPGSQVRLNWIDNSLVETGFQVERRRDTTNTWVPLPRPPASPILPPDTVTFDDTAASSSTKYFYRVRAVHEPYGYSAWSNIDEATTTAAAAATP